MSARRACDGVYRSHDRSLLVDIGEGEPMPSERELRSVARVPWAHRRSRRVAPLTAAGRVASAVVEARRLDAYASGAGSRRWACALVELLRWVSS